MTQQLRETVVLRRKEVAVRQLAFVVSAKRLQYMRHEETKYTVANIGAEFMRAAYSSKCDTKVYV